MVQPTAALQTYNVKDIPLMQKCFEEDLVPPSNYPARDAREAIAILPGIASSECRSILAPGTH